MDPDAHGFGFNTLIGERSDGTELTVHLVEAAKGRFEFQADATLADGTVLDMIVPAARTGGTGVFVRATP
jgi:hypothetical protein